MAATRVYSLVTNPHDIVGLKFKYCEVKNYLGKPGSGKYHCYLLRCCCGKEWPVLRQSLTGARKIQSCGCINKERFSKVVQGKIPRSLGGNFLHGKAGTSIYRRWNNMISRCTKPSSNRWKNYGGRGIKVCDSWMKFENFYKDMGDPPGPKMTLDRINSNGNYEPENCRWANYRTQANNRTNNRIILFQGRALTLAEWAREFEISLKKLWAKMQTRSPEEVLADLLFRRDGVRLTETGK